MWVERGGAVRGGELKAGRYVGGELQEGWQHWVGGTHWHACLACSRNRKGMHKCREVSGWGVVLHVAVCWGGWLAG